MADPALASRFWRSVEALHAVVYFAPDARDSYEAIGLRGFWMGYFASRSAALGPASPELVTALFFGFAPRMVERALPDAWARTIPSIVLTTREDLAVRTLKPLLPRAPVPAVTRGLEALLETLDLAGRPLAAAQLRVDGSDDPVARLWRAVTVLREYRGDGHVAALVAAGLDGAEANLSHAGTGALPAEQRANRGWSEEEWNAARRRLRARGWVDHTGALTPAGWAARQSIERATDVAVSRVFSRTTNLDQDDLMFDVIRLASGAVRRGVPYPNAMGVLPP